MSPLGCIIALIITEAAGADVRSHIKAGAGFSSDKQQVVAQRCYRAKVSSVSHQEGFAELGAAQSSSALEKVLGVSASAGGGYGVFSADANANYVRSVEENDFSITLNYYQYARNKVTVQLLNHGEKAIIKSFRSYYKDGNNPYFGMICGDYYIGSYWQGAVLTMGLKIEFKSSIAKSDFVANVGASFGDIVSASTSVEAAMTKHNIKGSVSIQAFQMGGAPSQLGHVLSSSDSGEYYALACSLTAMDNCIRAAGGLLDYAKNKFSNQFSTENNTGLTPLGIASSDPIRYIGLKTPPSLVTPEVERCRDELFNKLMENKYYQQKLHPFLNKGYPAELDDDFLKKASSVLSKADRNVDILMQANGGAADCFNFPDECTNIKAAIYSRLQNITASDLKFLEPVKYSFTTRGGMFYRGTGPDWHHVRDNRPGRDRLDRVLSANLTKEGYSYHNLVWSPSRDTPFIYKYPEGKPVEISPDGSITYSGVLMSASGVILNPNYKEYMRISPFFFDVFNVTQQSQKKK